MDNLDNLTINTVHHHNTPPPPPPPTPLPLIRYLDASVFLLEHVFLHAMIYWPFLVTILISLSSAPIFFVTTWILLERNLTPRQVPDSLTIVSTLLPFSSYLVFRNLATKGKATLSALRIMSCAVALVKGGTVTWNNNWFFKHTQRTDAHTPSCIIKITT